MTNEDVNTERYERMKQAADEVFQIMVKAATSDGVSIGLGPKLSIAWMADYIKASSKAYIAAMKSGGDQWVVHNDE